jgi:hypothetical protein
MNYWYFKFEGRFQNGDPQYGCKGVISSCLVPENDYEKARSRFLAALEENDIDLVDILECFELDGTGLDPADEVNTFWINWYQEAVIANEPVFDRWHVFDD